MTEPSRSLSPDGAADNGRRRPRRVAVALALIGAAVAIAIALAAVRILTGSSESGASSPQAAVSGLVAAVDRGDYLAALDLLPPDERQDLPAFIKATTAKIKASKIAGGHGLPDVTADVQEQQQTPLAQDVSAVTITGEVGLDLTGISGEIAALLPSGDNGRRDFVLPGSGPSFSAPDSRRYALPVRAIVIRQHGRWYVDPLLSAGDYLATRLALPGGDYADLGYQSGPAGSSPTDATTRLLQAVAAEDPSAAADVAAPAEERFLHVFGQAISELLRPYGQMLSIAGIELSDAGGGDVVLHRATIGVSRPYRSLSVSLVSHCIDWTWEGDASSRELCVPTQNGLRAEIGFDALTLATQHEPEGYRVALLVTLSRLLAQVATRLDDGAARGIVDLLSWNHDYGARIDSKAPVVGASGKVSGRFDGRLATMFDVHVEAGSRITITPGANDLLEVMSVFPNGGWETVTDGASQPVYGGRFSYVPKHAGTLRLLLTPRPAPECLGKYWNDVGVGLLTGCWWTPPGTTYSLTIAR